MFMEHALLVLSEVAEGSAPIRWSAACWSRTVGSSLKVGTITSGGLHAEQMAIHDAEEKGHSPNGSTAYVTAGTVQSLRSDTTVHRSLDVGRS